MNEVVFTIEKDGKYYNLYTTTKEFKNNNRKCSDDTLFVLMESISDNVAEHDGVCMFRIGKEHEDV